MKKSLVILLAALMALTLIVGCKKEPEVKNLDYGEFVGTWIYGDKLTGTDLDYISFIFNEDNTVLLSEGKGNSDSSLSSAADVTVKGSTITITYGDDEWKYNAEFKEDNLILTPVGESTWMKLHKDLKEITLEKCYTVTFNSDGGSKVSSQAVKKGNKATKPTDPTKTDNYLAAWNTKDGAKFNFNTEITEDIELKAAWKPTYTVGEQGPAGGIIFYDVDADNASGNADGLIAYDCGWRYLEASPNKISSQYEWTNRTSGSYGTKTGIGEGKSNTQALIDYKKKSTNSKFPAAEQCDSYTNGGYDDWFLPSKDELYKMYQLKDKTNLTGGYYWSSSESGSNKVWCIYTTGSNNQKTNVGSYDAYVRPVRMF